MRHIGPIRFTQLWSVALRFVLLFALWSVVGTLLVAFWPISPRFTLPDSSELQIGILTPDGTKLVTFTERAFRDTVLEYGKEIEKPVAVASGPIQIWDLQSGKCSTVCVPDQSCTGPLLTCRDSRHGARWVQRMEEPERWQLNAYTTRRTDEWNLFTLRRYDWEGGSFAEKFQQLLCNVKTGELRSFGPDPTSTIALSPSGRCYVKLFSTRPGRHLQNNFPSEIAVYETTSNRCLLQATMPQTQSAHGYNGGFVFDDRYFAAAGFTDEQASTRIWDLRDGRVLADLPYFLDKLTFAQAQPWVAGVQERASGECSFEVWDCAAGEMLLRRVDEYSYIAPTKLEFLGGDRWLISFSPSNSPESGRYFSNSTLDLMSSWDLQANEVRSYKPAADDESERLDVSTSPFGVVPTELSPLYFVEDAEHTRFFNKATDDAVFDWPGTCTPVLVTADGKTGIIETQNPSALTRLSADLPGYVVNPIVSNLQLYPYIYRYDCHWLVIDFTTGKTLATMPAIGDSVTISRDGKTLVTKSNTEPYQIQVWDFPVRQPLLIPLIWALAAPLLVVAWRRYRRRQVQIAPVNTPPGVPASTPAH